MKPIVDDSRRLHKHIEAFASIKWPGVSPNHVLSGRFAITKESSIFVDESDNQKGQSKHCIALLLFHRQSDVLESAVTPLEQDLRIKGEPNGPFHKFRLMYGKRNHAVFDTKARKKIVASFETIVTMFHFEVKLIVCMISI